VNKQNLEMLRVGVARTDRWLAILDAVNTELAKMGTFAEPSGDLKNLTLGQWDLERSRRATLAVLDFLISRSSDLE
jgi:hypothetical protein